MQQPVLDIAMAFFLIGVYFSLVRRTQDMRQVAQRAHSQEVDRIESDLQKLREEGVTAADIAMGVKRVFRANSKVSWRLRSLRPATVFSCAGIANFVLTLVLSAVLPKYPWTNVLLRSLSTIEVILFSVTLLLIWYIGTWYIGLTRKERPSSTELDDLEKDK